MTLTSSPIELLQRQRMLLQIEYQTEKEAYRQHTQTMGVGRKVKRGDAWYPLSVGRTFFNSMNQLVLEVWRIGDEEVEHNFEYGKRVQFFTLESGHEGGGDDGNAASGRVDGAADRVVFLPRGGRGEAVVSLVDGDRMLVTLPESAASAVQGCNGPVGVQLAFDETSYRTMFDALDRTIAARNNRLAYLRDLFHTRQRAQTLSFQPMRFPWLNTTQERAVNEVLRAKDVMVVHGPPGTGKTTTLVEAIAETLMRESQVLVCAQSNMAVDWISEKLVDRGIKVLRIGNPSRVNDKMLSFTYERQFESHPDYPQLWAIRKAIRELRQQKKGRNEAFHQKMDRLKSRATELELRIDAALFGEARVIASTLVGSASRLLEGRKFATLFIDEAAQALEAACWIPIRRVSRVVLAGDHCQLPPTVKSIAALKGGLGKTLMESIVEMKPECVTLLQVQYRMRNEIMQFSSNYFYGGKVTTASEIAHRGILDYDEPISWLDTSTFEPGPDEPDFREQFVGESFGRVNKGEAELTLQTLEQYLGKIGKERILDERIDVGIISPYRAQVQYLRRLIKRRAFFKPYRQLISVNTVDGFQGQERDIILISLVRSNDDGQIGFLRDLRRMNVAITRARMKLIILGDVPTMTRHKFYRELHEYLESIK